MKKKIDPLFDVEVVGQKVPGRLPTAFYACEGQYTLDEQGNPVAEPDLFKWAEWLEAATKAGTKRLAETTVGPYWVSTVFLALDHSFPAEAGTEGPPVLWETMIFGAWEEYEIIPGKPRRSRKSIDGFRYTSKAEALEGHARAVKLAESLPHSLPVEPEGNDESCPDKP